jgi:hypothetical protein
VNLEYQSVQNRPVHCGANPEAPVHSGQAELDACELTTLDLQSVINEPHMAWNREFEASPQMPGMRFLISTKKQDKAMNLNYINIRASVLNQTLFKRCLF